jgi:hypothetical protein
MGLNDHQQRRIEVSLAIIDRALMEIERYYLSAGPLTGELAEITNDLTPAEAAEIKQLAQEFRRRLKPLKDKFGLAPQRKDVRAILRGHFSHFWAVLHDCHSAKLKGYGSVDPELKTTLDPELDILLDLVAQLQRAIKPSD